MIPGAKVMKMSKTSSCLGKTFWLAPVAIKGQRSREVVFPEGRWQGDDGTTVEGPVKNFH